MTRFIVMACLVLCFGLSPSAADRYDSDFRVALETCSAAAIYVETVPPGFQATGFFMAFEDMSKDSVLFVSNKHVFSSGQKLSLTVLTVDTLLKIDGTVNVIFDLYTSDGDTLYVIPDDTLMDLAAIWVPRPGHRTTEVSLYTRMLTSWATKYSKLCAMMPVFYVGYPLSVRVESIKPLLQYGVISGVDSLNHVIYMDAQAFPGSSGSPVFLDFAKVEATYEGRHSPLVGVVAGYIPFRSYLINPQTGQVDGSQTENSGIAIVLPAQEVVKLAEKARVRR